MADPLSPAISDRICNHMNQDHADAVVLYAQTFGHLQQATAAHMERIDPQGMDLTAQVEGSPIPIRIEFDHALQDSEDAHQTLIAMIKQARASA
jgi:putative heme iron utilization protein